MLHKRSPWLTVTLLIMLEQGLKLIINRYYLQSQAVIIPRWLYFSPMFNRDYSWLNSLFQLNIGRLTHILLVGITIALAYLFYRFVRHNLETDRLIDTTFAFLFAGALCSLIDKVFWNGSLDYIELSGYFTFDLKDAYLNVFIGLVILIFVINHRGVRQVNDETVLKDFWSYLWNK